MREGNYSELEDEGVPILINNSYGGYRLSEEAKVEYEKRRKEGNSSQLSNSLHPDRTDPILIELFKEWGTEKMSGQSASLYLGYIPHDAYIGGFYEIAEYDSSEFIKINEEKQQIKELISLVRTVIFSERDHKDKVELLGMAFHNDTSDLTELITNLKYLPLGEVYEASKSSYTEKETARSTDTSSLVKHSIFNVASASINPEIQEEENCKQSEQIFGVRAAKIFGALSD